MKFTAALALVLMQTAPAFAGYLCVMSDGNPNPGTSICTAAGGTPERTYPAACCLADSKKGSYENGCKDNGGIRAQYTYIC
ncbi:hypothetical protein CkaCkLH20_09210 [Colletotrichum karsti]|uniref:Uncharacterized protein n=1 Tax=Colletotrichum karsti TaxID=1095194 RepID=A0A9P6I082_9PEZI|nr:uncharacterized protein CkaCkLH20_09210 [Colletotrichum karsti]KAF9873397.1 hypothetical protein CkaCkLH20_09210 [Colletotrichum karsti]